MGSFMGLNNHQLLDHCLGSPDIFANPYPVYQRLQVEAPVFWSQRFQAWVVSCYEDVKSVLLDPTRFSSANEVEQLLAQLPEATQGQLAIFREHYRTGGLVHSDPPVHTRLRGLVHKAFTPWVVRNLRPFIEQTVNQLLDKVLATGKMDVIGDLAFPLPAIVIAKMLGVEAAERDHFRAAAEKIMAFAGSGQAQADLAIQAQEGLIDLLAHFRRLLALRRQSPRDDLLSNLVQVEEAGDRLSEQELLGTCVTLLIAGFETTTHLIGNGLLALLHHPEQWARLRRKPELMAMAVEEFLRFNAPLQGVRRIVREDTLFSGQQMRQGEIVYALIGAANRDPVQFGEPDQLQIGRSASANKHLGFGHGIHYCLGAPLARLEATITLTILLRRLPQMELSEDDLIWKHNILLHGLHSLKVES